jgi:anti-sigma regulatory factor (Ser/Thr protein kinase)
MFVTCLYAVFDPKTGKLVYANAGHDVPYRRTASGVVELRARGMPLGLMPGMKYEEKETTLRPGETVILYSDGLVEAHDPDRQMFGFPRLQSLMAELGPETDVVPYLLGKLAEFTGPDWEQEDDVTLVLLRGTAPGANGETLLARLHIPSAEGNERRAMNEVATVVAPLGLDKGRVDKLKTAVAEATMNAMEHGNRYDPARPVLIEVARDPTHLVVRITDEGSGPPIPEAHAPNIDAKLAGEQSPRGWGLYLIENMVDEVHVTTDEAHHTVSLVLHLNEGADHAQ